VNLISGVDWLYSFKLYAYEIGCICLGGEKECGISSQVNWLIYFKL
jgi:hypothetical protein